MNKRIELNTKVARQNKLLIKTLPVTRITIIYRDGAAKVYVKLNKNQSEQNLQMLVPNLMPKPKESPYMQVRLELTLVRITRSISAKSNN